MLLDLSKHFALLMWSGAEMCQQRSSRSFCWKSCRAQDMEVCQRSETQKMMPCLALRDSVGQIHQFWATKCLGAVGADWRLSKLQRKGWPKLMQRWRPSEGLACSLHRKSFRALEDLLCSNRLPQVKQAVAMQWIDQRQRELGDNSSCPGDAVFTSWEMLLTMPVVYPFRVKDLESYFWFPDKRNFKSCCSSQICRSDESANSEGHERNYCVTCWRHLQRILIRNEDVGPRVKRHTTGSVT